MLRSYLFLSLKKKNPTPSFLSGGSPGRGEIGFVNAPLTNSEV
jgi:hypothetical protein